MRLSPIVIALVLAGCAEYDLSNDRGGVDPLDQGDEDTDGNEAPDDNTGDTDPPETEDDFIGLEPAQTDVYVFIANPARDTVTRVQVYTHDVDTSPVGRNPREVITTPDYAHAVVFNMNDDSVSILASDTLDTWTTGVRKNFNTMNMSPDGAWVGLRFDPDAVRPDDPDPEGLQSFNEISLVKVPEGDHYGMAVGPNPRSIQFSPDGTMALVVSDTDLAVIDLTADELRPTMIPVTDNLVDPPKAEEVVVSPSGQFAFVRQFGATELVIVDLGTGTVDYVDVGVNPTDLDLTPDGTQAVAVARASEQLWVFDSEDPFATPVVHNLPLGENLGSLLFDPLGNQALLYTTATLTDRYATWDLETQSITLRSLVKPVAGMAITPTGESVMVFHTLDDAPTADPEDPFYGEWAMTLIDLFDYRQNPLLLPSEPIGYSNSNNGNFGYFIMEGEPFLEMVDYSTLLYDEVPLKSNPVYVGVLPDLDFEDGDEPSAWASQEHDLGRITFFDPDDGLVQTITGFELNSNIED
jgi:DNA-binding beta-propeller fold protein YncE